MMSLDIVVKRVTGIELIEQKIGEAIGLEQAAQKVVYQFQSRGLFKQKYERIHGNTGRGIRSRARNE